MDQVPDRRENKPLEQAPGQAQAPEPQSADDYVIRVLDSPAQVDARAWDALLAAQSLPTPFMRHAYLGALHDSGSATQASGWTPKWITLWDRRGELAGACALYLKDHSFGEYVFDWAWARAYAEHGMDYYPKAVIAVPFTPVPGSRLPARDAPARAALLRAATGWCGGHGVSSLHLLFASDDDLQACAQAGLMLRHTVQFHWHNPGYADFDAFLAALSQDKRKKIRQERRRVAEAGVRFRALRGADIGPAEWAFFRRCYERTYLEHGNPPYLTAAFFEAMRTDMAGHWLMFIAEREGRPIASSLIGLDTADAREPPQVAYGRYWGALERVDCLHFEACYYQPIEWCIAHGVRRFEGGAQGEHKMARALMPVRASSAHWLAHPAFAQAVERFLLREGEGVDEYLEHLGQRTPFRQAP